MPSDEEQIANIKRLMLARIDEVITHPKTTYDIGPHRLTWPEYLEQLGRAVDWCNEKLGQKAAWDGV